jgi:hypothetical protein
MVDVKIGKTADIERRKNSAAPAQGIRGTVVMTTHLLEKGLNW